MQQIAHIDKYTSAPSTTSEKIKYRSGFRKPPDNLQKERSKSKNKYEDKSDNNKICCGDGDSFRSWSPREIRTKGKEKKTGKVRKIWTKLLLVLRFFFVVIFEALDSFKVRAPFHLLEVYCHDFPDFMSCLRLLAVFIRPRNICSRFSFCCLPFFWVSCSFNVCTCLPVFPLNSFLVAFCSFDFKLDTRLFLIAVLSSITRKTKNIFTRYQSTDSTKSS